MRQLTVAEIVRLALPPDTQVVAGAAGLGRAVNWVRAAGTRPLDAGALEEGDLVVFAPLPAAAGGEGARRLVALLVDLRAAGLLLIQSAPAPLVEAADAADLPLLVAPPGSRAADLERAVVALIVDSRSQLRQRADETYQRLTRIALEDRGLGALVQALADTMRKIVVIQDEYGAVQEAAAPGAAHAAAVPGGAPAPVDGPAAALATDAGLPTLDAVLPELRATVRDLPWPGREALRSHRLVPTRLSLGATPLQRLVLPIVLRQTMAGFLSIVGPASTFDELDELTLGPAAVVCALEIAKQRAVAETEYRLQADVLESALAGRFASETEVVARARTLGYELDGEQVALAFALDSEPATGPLSTAEPPPGPGGAQSGGASDRLRPRLLDTLRRALESHPRPALVRQQDERVAVFVPLAGTDLAAILREAEQLRLAAAAVLDGTTLSVGVGRPHVGVPGLSAGYREAREALLIGQALLGGNRTTSFGDLGIRRLLFPLRDSPELREFYDEFLGSLENYDERHGTELIRTLEGFFAHHGNHVRAAEALHLHRNTLLYRLARIKEIGGIDLDDPEARLAVQVALRLRPLTVPGRQTATAPAEGNGEGTGAAPRGSRGATYATSTRPSLAGREGEDGQS